MHGMSECECDHGCENTVRIGQESRCWNASRCRDGAWFRSDEGSSRGSSGCSLLSRCGVTSAPERPGHSYSSRSLDGPQDLRAPGFKLLTSWHQDLLNISGWKVPSSLLSLPPRSWAPEVGNLSDREVGAAAQVALGDENVSNWVGELLVAGHVSLVI